MYPDTGSDEVFLKRCFELAAKGKGAVSPNPLVGAVVVKNGKVIGEGYHKNYGEAHAEVSAFNNLRGDAVGATLYCNLEPCCHIKNQGDSGRLFLPFSRPEQNALFGKTNRQ